MVVKKEAGFPVPDRSMGRDHTKMRHKSLGGRLRTVQG